MKKILKWYYGFADLKKKLMMAYGLVVLLPVLIFGISSYHSSYKNFFNQTKLSMEDAVSSMEVGIENSISRENDNLRFFTYNVNLRESLEASKVNFTTFSNTLVYEVEPVFWYFIASDDNLNRIKIYSPYIPTNIGDFCNVSESVEKEAWYREGQKNFQTIWRIEEQKIYATKTILDIESSSKPIGIMELELDFNKIMGPVRHIDGKNSGTLLLDNDGNIIFKTLYHNEKIENEVESFILQYHPEEFVVNDNFLVTGERKLTNGWKLYYFLDRTLLDRHLGEIQMTTILMMAISFAFVMLLGNIISAILGNRVLRLKEAAEEISCGNFNVNLDLRYDDELGNLNKSFDMMQKQMNKMMEEMYHLGMEKRKVELTALQAKINPHFLYNCLSAIKWKAIKKGDEDIAEITGLLAKFYRSNLNEGKALTSVENELETVRTYLEIQKNTHEGSFDIEFYLDEEGRNIKMPHFLLQPIVENSIVHGIDTLPEGQRGRIMVIYRKEEGYLVFEIKNSIASSEALRLEEQGEIISKGYGLYNIKERIRLYYDNRNCGIERTMPEDDMVSFTVRIGEELKSVDLEQDAGLINR